MDTSELKECCLCGIKFSGWGNNPYPLGKKDTDECCDACNSMYVVPARILGVYKNGKTK